MRRAWCRPPIRGGTRSTEAYQLYLAAVWRSQGGRAADIDRSVALLEQALRVDPRYALAWTELAWVYRRRLWNADARPAEVFALASPALQRALAVVPALPQALAGKGFTRYWFDFDWPGAEAEFRQALAANQNVTSARHGLATLLLTQGRLDEGFVHLRRMRELDPMSPVFNTLEASYLTSYGSLAEARKRLARAFDLTPNQWLAYVALGQLDFAEARFDAGIAALRRAVVLGPDTSRPPAVLAVHLARAGQTDEARAILQQLQLRAQQRFVTPTSLAAVHAALGESAAAVDALELALQVRDTRLIYLKNDPNWAGLHGEPRFAALVGNLNQQNYGKGLTPV